MGSKLCCVCDNENLNSKCSKRRKRPMNGDPGSNDQQTNNKKIHYEDFYLTTDRNASSRKCMESSPNLLRDLILQVLDVTKTQLESHMTPNSLQTLQQFADNETNWMLVMEDLVYIIPPDQPLAPVAVSVIVEESCVPSKELITRLSETLNVNDQSKVPSHVKVNRKKNICILLACLAEKMAGPTSVTLLSNMILSFLFECIRDQPDPTLVLYALIALEKFALTGENKSVILERLKTENILSDLERHHDNDLDFRLRQVGFWARWSLDNLFVIEGRIFSYTTTTTPTNNHDTGDNGPPTTTTTAAATTTTTNVILNHNDVSEYLKLSSTGLEARCDAPSFESVRCTLPVVEGVWYYEVKVVTSGVMQIGWASKYSKFLTHEGYGIGDDDASIAYDGCRQLIWYGARSTRHTHKCWKPGDILGLLLNIDKKEVIFSLNGRCLPPNKLLFSTYTPGGYYAAASFMSYQQCIFNFGASPFKHPPQFSFKKLNDYGMLTPQQRTILPRHMKMSYLRHISIAEDSCTICVDHKACIKLHPCGHTGFCQICADILENCPLCRQKIEERIKIDPSGDD